jgi:hypothetical protein
MMTSETALAQTALPPDGELMLGTALRTGVPVAAVLGQRIGWSETHGDPVLRLALKKASKPGEGWKSLLSREPLPQGFYEWLGERFLNDVVAQIERAIERLGCSQGDSLMACGASKNAPAP